jgi:putative transposase
VPQVRIETAGFSRCWLCVLRASRSAVPNASLLSSVKRIADTQGLSRFGCEKLANVPSCDECHSQTNLSPDRDSYQGTHFRRAETSRRIRSRLLVVVMAIPLRHADPALVAAGARTFFVTSSIAGKRNLLQSERSARLFIRVLYDYRAQRKFRLHEFVVMPDHFHLLLTVDHDSTIERAVQFIKGGFAFRAGKELGFHAPVWQKGFSEVRILDHEAFLRTADYIRNNPVMRHLVDEAAGYPHSSAHSGLELDPAPQGLKPNL